MAKSLYGHRIGADVKEKDPPAGVKLVPDNKTLMVMSFNDDHDDDVDPVRLKSLNDIFAHYQPQREIVFDAPDDETEEVTLKFGNLKDFSKDGIIAQSKALGGLQERADIYSRLLDVLQNNDSLRNILKDDAHKKEFLELVETLIAELGEGE